MKNNKKIIEEFRKWIKDKYNEWYSDKLNKEIENFWLSKLARQKQELIKEFASGKRCLNCGAKKDNNLTDFCGKCIENL